jgi:hypothetical protein
MVKKSLILCEGGEDVGLLKRLIEVTSISTEKIEVRKLRNNKSDFFDQNNYEIILSQFSAGLYSKVLFIVDADCVQNDKLYGGYAKTEQELKIIISTLGFDSVADIFIACDPLTTEGNMEHLLLSTTEKSKRVCIETLIDCINGKQTYSNKKIIYSGYLNIFSDIPYNFDHAHFNELKNKLTWLIK